MMVRQPIFPNEGEEAEIVFAHTEAEATAICGNGKALEFDGFHGWPRFSDDLRAWLAANVGTDNFTLTYCMGYRLRLRRWDDALLVKLRWG
jgi:hypothetical protein